MGIFRLLKNNFLTLLFIFILLFSGARIYLNQEEHLDKLAKEKEAKTLELEHAKDHYDKIAKLEELSNTSESKETQIRERLNMIKKDEIQFLFSKDK